MVVVFECMLIAILVSLSFFYYFNQKSKKRRADQKEKLKEVRNEFIEKLIETKKGKSV